MRFVLAGLVVGPMLLLAGGALTGRVRARSCCAAADPAHDLRMRGAFPGPPLAGPQGDRASGSVRGLGQLQQNHDREAGRNAEGASDQDEEARLPRA